jgi:hypothetical protein
MGMFDVVCYNCNSESATSSQITYRLKLGLICDNEAISVGCPMDDGTIILAFSIQHLSELLVRRVALRQKEQ